MRNIEAKVIAAAAGSGLGAALSAFLLWVVGVLGFGASSASDQVPKALAAVPEPVGALLAILVAIGATFLAGFAAPHTSRPDLAPKTPVIIAVDPITSIPVMVSAEPNAPTPPPIAV